MDGWGTNTAERPLELSHPSGAIITPLVYADRLGRASLIEMSPAVSLGERALDGKSALARITHGGTTLLWQLGFEGNRASLAFKAEEFGEWGLRFWVVFCLSGAPWREAGATTFDGGGMVVSCRAAPLLVTAHDTPEAVAQEFDQEGYFYLASRAKAGRCLALRFNLEETPTLSLTISPTAEAPASCSLPPLARGVDAPGAPLQAVHDVMAWNHVFDRVNQRPTTVLTRAWNNRKFGGFGVWMNDIIYNALLWGLFDAEKAWQNLEAVFAFQTEAGNFPCLMTGRDSWIDRSQPPIVSFVVAVLAARHPEADFIRRAFPKLLKNHEWWWRTRVPDDRPLVVYGTTPGVGSGLYAGTKLGAKNESSMDNMAVHDPAPFDAARGLLLSYDVGLNALLALDGECLADMAAALGDTATAARLTARSAAQRAAIGTHLWDEARGVFANRLVSGAFVEPLAPTSFFPLVAGAASEAQARALVTGWLDPPGRFGGAPGLPSSARHQPAYSDNVYWRGRIWAPHNFWVLLGLRRMGWHARADALATMGWSLFAAGWADRLCGENFNAETGAITDQPDTDAFYAWGALLPALCVGAAIDVTPWDGLRVAVPTGPVGPVATPFGPMTVSGPALTVGWPGGGFALTAPAITHLRPEADGFSFVLPAGEMATLTLPGPPHRVRVGEGAPQIIAGALVLAPRTDPVTILVRREG